MQWPLPGITAAPQQNRLQESVRKAAQRPEAPASGYCWDAFISYHRDPDFDRWMTKVFSILQKNLANYLGGQAKIFIDVRDIELGDRWTDELKDALRTSKCLIPFIEPAYFASQWIFIPTTLARALEPESDKCLDKFVD